MNVHILQLKCALRSFLITSFRTALRSHRFLHSIYYDLKLSTSLLFMRPRTFFTLSPEPQTVPDPQKVLNKYL